jgi:hypothetical protein
LRFGGLCHGRGDEVISDQVLQRPHTSFELDLPSGEAHHLPCQHQALDQHHGLTEILD